MTMTEQGRPTIEELIEFHTRGATDGMAHRLSEGLTTPPVIPQPRDRANEPQRDPRDALIAAYAALQRDRGKRKRWWRR